MKSRHSFALALAAALLASSAASAAEYALVMPTGAVVSCSELDSIRFKDMPRLYGINNYSKEYEQYVRFHTFAPRDCKRAASRDLARRESQPWHLVAQRESEPSR